MAAAAFDDLQPCTLFPSDWGTLAVGWLAKDRPFAKGPVAPEVLRALHRLGQPSCVLSFERQCELCPPGTSYTQRGLFFVPSARGLFVAPRMLIHSIRGHGYLPPAEFLQAVRECPPGDSAEYRAALEAGPGGAQRPQPRERGEYDAAFIDVLDPADGIRRRPAMYVGSTGIDGLRESFRVVVQQAVVEHCLGFAKRVRVEFDDGWLTVEDDGRGVGTGVDERFGRPVIEKLFTNFHPGDSVGTGRAVHPWTPTLGIGAVTALSSQMEVTSTSEDETQRAVFESGRLVSLRRGKAFAMQGLRIRCLPDPLIFDGKLEPAHVEEELTQLAWLCPRLEVSFQGRVVPNKDGPLTWVRALAPRFVEETGLTAHEVGAMRVDVGLGWSRNQRAPNLVSLVNFRRTSGGSHEEGLLTALRRAAERRGTDAARLLAGLTAVVHVGFDHPALEGDPARSTLNSPEVAGAVERAVTRAIDAAPWWWDRVCEAM